MKKTIFKKSSFIYSYSFASLWGKKIANALFLVFVCNFAAFAQKKPLLTTQDSIEYAVFTADSLGSAMRMDSTIVKTLNEVAITDNALRQTSSITCILSMRNNATLDNFKNLQTGKEPTFILASQTPNITVTSDAGNSSGYSYLRMRGIDQSRLSITLNGIPLNDPEDQNVYFSNFTDILEGMQSVTVTQGIGSLRNGAAAYGGAITLESNNLQQKTGRIFANYGSYNTYRLGGEFGTKLSEKAAIYARISKTHSEGYREHSANDAFSGMFSAGYFGKKNTLKFTTIFGQQANQLAWIGSSQDSLSRNPRHNANTKDEKDAFKQIHAQLYYSQAFTPNIFLKACVYTNYNNGGYTFDLNNFYGGVSNGELIGYQQTANTVGGYANLNYQKNNFKATAGVFFSNMTKNHIGSLLKHDTLSYTYANIGTKKEINVYGKANYTFKKWDFFADLQYRKPSFEYDGTIAFSPLYWEFFNVSASANFKINDHISAYYAIGDISREPSRTDFFVGYDNLESINGILQFKNLKPEQVLDNELGIAYKNKDGMVKLNLYRMDFLHENTLTGKYGETGLPIHAEVNKSHRMGLELSAKWAISSILRFTSNIAYSSNNINSPSGLQPVLTPKLCLNHWFFVAPLKNLDLGIGGQFQEEAFIDFYNQEKIPAFFVANFAATYTYKKVYTTVHLNNLLNNSYITSGAIGADGSTPAYFKQMPFNFNVGVGYRFF